MSVIDLTQKFETLNSFLPCACRGQYRSFFPQYDTAKGDASIDPSLGRELSVLPPPVEAAVLVGVEIKNNLQQVLLTTRATALKSHPGQIAFTGGKLEPEETPVEAALREAHEEISLDQRHVTPIGILSPYRSFSGFLIYPILATISAHATYEPNPAEVADIFHVPADFLFDLNNHRIEKKIWRGVNRRYISLEYDRRKIWGVTAGIIHLMTKELLHNA